MLPHAEETEQQRAWRKGRPLQLASLLIRELITVKLLKRIPVSGVPWATKKIPT